MGTYLLKYTFNIYFILKRRLKVKKISLIVFHFKVYYCCHIRVFLVYITNVLSMFNTFITLSNTYLASILSECPTRTRTQTLGLLGTRREILPVVPDEKRMLVMASIE